MEVSSSPVEDLLDAKDGFNLLFSDNIEGAKAALQRRSSPFHSLGVGVVNFLQAALGLEKELVPEACRLLSLAEQGAKQALKAHKTQQSAYSTRFTPGLEWEILQADAVVLNGVTHALNETYMGYAQALYALNRNTGETRFPTLHVISAHSKFSKLFRTAFPDGLDAFETPITTLASNPSISELSSPGTSVPPPKATLLGRLGLTSGASTPKASRTPSGTSTPVDSNDMDDFIVAGAAFGYGLYALVFSLLPAKVKSVVGWLGFKSDRTLALRALALAATKKDVHSVFAALTLMTYYGILLGLLGWQCDETKVVGQYQKLLEPVQKLYPGGSLWILNKARLLRLTCRQHKAIEELRVGLDPNRISSFRQADALLIFEMAWCYVGMRQYEQAAALFARMTEANNWSNATYFYLAAGCHVSAGDLSKAQTYFDKANESLNLKRASNARELPTEIFVKKKLKFFEQQHRKKSGFTKNYAESVSISNVEEMAIFWNIHDKIPQSDVEPRIRYLLSLSPAREFRSPYQPCTRDDHPQASYHLGHVEEVALRDLLLGILHRTAGQRYTSRQYLNAVMEAQSEIQGTWMVAIATFELAIVELKEMDNSSDQGPEQWRKTLKSAAAWVDKASTFSGAVDMSGRIDARVTILRDEMALKQATLIHRLEIN